MPDRGLGWRRPSDTRHLEKYPLTASTVPRTPTPVVIGIDWFLGMDEPVERNGALWITPGDTQVRGGHCICIEPPDLKDNPSWWPWYSQGNEGACVSFAISRMQSLRNRRKYSPWPLYMEALRTDEFPGEDPAGGTSTRAGLEVARTMGMWKPKGGRIDVGVGPNAAEGISVYRWARDMGEIVACLSPADDGKRVRDAGYVTLLNSWGRDFPHRVRLSLEDLEWLVFQRGGEAAVVTDR